MTEISVREIGDEFQALWIDKVSEKTRFLTDRSPAALRWHYEIPGDRGIARVLCCSKNGRLLGYAVVRNEPPDENGLRKSIVADMLAREDEPSVIEALLAAAHDQAQSCWKSHSRSHGFPGEYPARVCTIETVPEKVPSLPLLLQSSRSTAPRGHSPTAQHGMPVLTMAMRL